jgi:SAM-dependent methyltransferase
LCVCQAEALAYLGCLAENSQSLITGFHFIEHLSFEQRRRLLTEMLRVLRPRGLVILETPNPNNILVGASRFYLDHPHLRPLPPEATAFLFETFGFAAVEIRVLNPAPAEQRVPGRGDPLVARFNHYFYGPQDYGVIARKPA